MASLLGIIIGIAALLAVIVTAVVVGVCLGISWLTDMFRGNSDRPQRDYPPGGYPQRGMHGAARHSMQPPMSRGSKHRSTSRASAGSRRPF